MDPLQNSVLPVSPSSGLKDKNWTPCKSCQHLKRKCDGRNGERCSHCVKRKKECIYQKATSKDLHVIQYQPSPDAKEENLEPGCVGDPQLDQQLTAIFLSPTQGITDSVAPKLNLYIGHEESKSEFQCCNAVGIQNVVSVGAAAATSGVGVHTTVHLVTGLPSAHSYINGSVRMSGSFLSCNDHALLETPDEEAISECYEVNSGVCEDSPGSEISMDTDVLLDGTNEDFKTLDDVPLEQASAWVSLKQQSVLAFKGNPVVFAKKKNAEYSEAVQRSHDFFADQERASRS